MTARDDALTLAVVRTLGVRVRAAEQAAKGALDEEMTAGERLAAKLPDGTIVAWVPKVRGATHVAIVNLQEFTRWVRREYPTEVTSEVIPAEPERIIPAQPERTVHTVRPAFEKKLVAQWKELGAAVDPNGEEIPGVQVTAGDPHVKVELTPDADAAVMAAWAGGVLSPVDLLQLPTPASADTPKDPT